MHITYLGHAGFCVETSQSLIIIDPWMSPLGAFDASWFQYPCNHHLAAYVQEKLQSSTKDKFLYISHEHKDHLDPIFLDSLQQRDFTVIIPAFRRQELARRFEDYRCKTVLTCADGQELPIPGGSITLYVDDSEMDRDSSILIKADNVSFLNINDCKIHDRLSAIISHQGPIDVFTAQYSGATWHPTCYDYPKKTYDALSKRKMYSKFEAVARAIKQVKPRFYLTSAGPPCFLDPSLIHLNFEEVNIFPRAKKFIDYLDKRLKSSSTQNVEPQPGDTLDVESGKWVTLASERVTDEQFESYVRSYASRYQSFFEMRRIQHSGTATDDLLQQLEQVLKQKLGALTLHQRIKIPLYFRFTDHPSRFLKVNFPQKTIETVTDIEEVEFYSITTPSWEVNRLLSGNLTWEDFTLTFRMTLSRMPDIYHILIHGFLMMEPEDVDWFCKKVLAAETNKERTLLSYNGDQYCINRFCPHQGADLTQGWVEKGRYLTCPRHRWQFDLKNEGKCTTNDSTIDAVSIEGI